MFKKTHTRLTIFFTILMLLFSSSFIFASYAAFSITLYQDSKEYILTLAEKEFYDHQEDLDKFEEKGEMDSIDYEENSRSFYYAVHRSGRLVDGDEIFPELRTEILERLRGWQPESNDIRIEEFHLKNKDDVYFIIAGKKVYKSGKWVGMIYAGEDITRQHQTVNRIAIILIAISIFFIFVSSILGYYMAGRAMLPIARSFNRQQQFVADASHELRTPLSILHSSLEVLDREEREHLSPFSQQIIDDMKEEVQRLSSLVGDLLTLARADSGSLQILPESFDVTAVVHQLARSFQPLLRERNQTLTMNVPQQVILYADKERMMQLLYILLDNASKYTPSGGDIKLELQETGKGKDRSICISVQDTGIGIPPEEQERIFDRFYRVAKERSREQGGTGLGLSIASWIVQAHNGSIDVTSRPGQGSTFTVRFAAKHVTKEENRQ